MQNSILKIDLYSNTGKVLISMTMNSVGIAMCYNTISSNTVPVF